jgi:hypothetical protein
MKLASTNLISPSLDGKAIDAVKSSGSKLFRKDFLLLLGKEAKGADRSSALSQTESSAGKKLESSVEKLRRTLLAHGKSPSRSSLNGEDVLLLRNLLCECGLAPAAINAFMNRLLQQSENGEISLFRF